VGPHLDPAQRVFVAWVDHHLRGRLHLADAYVSALVAGPLDAEQRQAAAAVQAVTRQLLATLDELLDGADPAGGDEP
jgi:hypothetical protein